MRVIINLMPLNEGAIIRERSLLFAMSKIDNKNEYIILCQRHTKDYFAGLRWNYKCIYLGLNMRNYVKRLIWENINLPLFVKRLKGDIVYFPYQFSSIFNFAKKIIGIRNSTPFEEAVIKKAKF